MRNPEGKTAWAMDFRFFAPLRMTFAENEKALQVATVHKVEPAGSFSY